jgi:hypothetical protein
MRDSPKTSFALWLALALLPASGCPDGGSGKAVPFAEFPAQLQAAWCEAAATCGEAPDPATCVNASCASGAEWQTTQDAVAQGKIVYDASAAGHCLELMRSAPCKRSSKQELARMEATCAGVFTGATPAGAACPCRPSDFPAYPGCPLCESGVCDDSAGTCAAVPTRGGAGATCPSSDACADGLYCAPEDSTCHAQLAAGTACAHDDQCAGTTVCYGSPGSATCRVAPAEGETCALPAREGGCDDNVDTHYCDATASTCKPLPAPGEACAMAAEGQLQCVGYAGCIAGTCVARGGVGDSCDAERRCLDPLTCQGGTCAAAEPPGSCIAPMFLRLFD